MSRRKLAIRLMPVSTWTTGVPETRHSTTDQTSSLVLPCQKIILPVTRWQQGRRGSALAIASYRDPDSCDRCRDMTFRSDRGIRGIDSRWEGDALG